MFAGFTILLCITLFIIFLLYMSRNFNYWKKRGVKFLNPIPIFGNIKDICLLKTTIGEFCETVYKNTELPFIGLFVLDEPCLLVRDLEMIKNILVQDFEYFHDRTMTNNEKHDRVGSNLLFLMKSQKWRDLRRKITPVFSSGKIKSMSALLLQCGENMADYLREKLNHGEDTLEVRELCAKFATDSITSTSFGLEAGSFKNEDAPFRVIARRIYNWKLLWHAIQTTCFFLAPKLVHLFRMTFIDDVCSDFFRDVFWRMMKEREKTKFVRNDLLDILIEMRKKDLADNKASLDEDELLAQAAQFFIAGFESSSSTMYFLLLEWALNPEIQEKVREEIISVQKKHNGFCYNGLQEMEYLENNINEVLRKYPILPFLDRRCSKRYAIPGSNLVLDEGVMVYIPIMGIQHDPKYFPEPDRFDPDRFKKENLENNHPMTFLPFGDGPRNCIGRRYALVSVKSGLVHILSNFRVKLCEKTNTDMKFSPKGFTLQPDHGIVLRFEELQKNNL